jgi:Protein of unknown function (DUF1579)
MKRISIIVPLTILFAMALAQAQMPMPKPGPELKKLEYFAGNWSVDGDMKPGPMGPGGKFTGTMHNEWMDGGFFLLSHSEGSSSMGNDKGLAVWGYDAENKVYTYHAFNNFGQAISANGSPDGDTWNWTNEEKMMGKMVKGRYTIKQVSPTAYNFKLEMQPEGGDWALVMEGKAAKK